MAFMDRRTLTGVVVSNKSDKTAVVQVERLTRHPLYRRTMKRRKKYHAHDPHNACNMGDVVRIVEYRPMSRLKRWLVVAIIRKGDVPEVRPKEIGATEASS
jgi:small subunit ribosomal protein S17